MMCTGLGGADHWGGECTPRVGADPGVGGRPWGGCCSDVYRVAARLDGVHLGELFVVPRKTTAMSVMSVMSVMPVMPVMPVMSVMPVMPVMPVMSVVLRKTTACVRSASSVRCRATRLRSTRRSAANSCSGSSTSVTRS